MVRLAFYYFDLNAVQQDRNVGMLNNYAYYLAESNKNLEKALNLSLYTIQKEPQNATYLDTYAWILYKQKMFKSALKYIKLAYKCDKNKNYDIIIHYGDIAFCNRKMSLAYEKWNEAIKLGADKMIIVNKINTIKCD